MALRGTSVIRREDDPLLRGDANFVADLRFDNPTYVFYLTSTMAHAEIASINISDALSMPGVLDIITNADLDIGPYPAASPLFDNAMIRPLLADGRVRFVGEPIAAVIAETTAQAVDAAEMIDVDYRPLDVVVHPESIVHSLVEFCDTSVLAQLGLPDMRVPIAVALAHPERIRLDLPRLSLSEVGRLEFEAPDRERFPCLDLATSALKGSESAPAVLNAANEVAVQAFLDRKIPFSAIAETNAAVLDEHLRSCQGESLASLDDVLRADGWARAVSRIRSR